MPSELDLRNEMMGILILMMAEVAHELKKQAITVYMEIQLLLILEERYVQMEGK